MKSFNTGPSHSPSHSLSPDSIIKQVLEVCLSYLLKTSPGNLRHTGTDALQDYLTPYVKSTMYVIYIHVCKAPPHH